MGEGFDSGLLAGLLGDRGVDPGVVAMMNDRTRDNGWGCDGGIWIVLLFLFMLGMGGNGWGARNAEGGVSGVDRTVVNEANMNRLMDAVSTQGTRQEVAVQGLAQSLNCSVDQVRNALADVDKQIAVNQGSVVNAVQSCCCNVQNRIGEASCQTNLNIERTGNVVTSRLQEQTYNMASQFAAQTALINDRFAQQSAYLAEQFCQIKMREDAREIQSLRDRLAEERASSQTAIILQALRNRDTVSFTGTVNDDTVTGTGTIS